MKVVNVEIGLIDKLVDECDENIDEETSLVEINSKKCKHNSCIL